MFICLGRINRFLEAVSEVNENHEAFPFHSRSCYHKVKFVAREDWLERWNPQRYGWEMYVIG